MKRTFRTLGLAGAVVLLGTGCLTSYFVADNDASWSYTLPVTPSGAASPVLEARASPNGTRLQVKYAVKKEGAGDERFRYATLDTQVLFNMARKAKPRGGSDWTPGIESARLLAGTWVDDNVAGQPILEGDTIIRRGKLLHPFGEDAVHVSKKPCADTKSMAPLDFDVFPDIRRFNVETPGLLAVLRDPKENVYLGDVYVWYTASLPEDLGGGTCLICFRLEPERRFRPGGYLMLPLTLPIDIATMPVLFPWAIVQSIKTATKPKE